MDNDNRKTFLELIQYLEAISAAPADHHEQDDKAFGIDPVRHLSLRIERLTAETLQKLAELLVLVQLLDEHKRDS